jgi:para-nitrobenzyl esterase
MKKLFTIVICLVLVISVALFFSFTVKNESRKNSDTVRVEGGFVSGVTSKLSNVISFKGIPFAAPPVGELRRKAPQPVKPWSGVKNCYAFGPSPMQSKPVPFMVYTREFLIPEEPISEDCLYLNVWAKSRAAVKKPVFV